MSHGAGIGFKELESRRRSWSRGAEARVGVVEIDLESRRAEVEKLKEKLKEMC